MLDGVLMDSTAAVMLRMRNAGAYHVIILFMIFIILTAITILNMLIGVLCEVVAAVGSASQDEFAISVMKSSILKLLMDFDDDGNGLISSEEFAEVLQHPESIDVLESLEVDLGTMMQLRDMMYKEPGSCLHISEVMDIILCFRGDRPSMVRDIVDVGKLTQFELKRDLENFRGELDETLQGIKRIMMFGSTCVSPPKDETPFQETALHV